MNKEFIDLSKFDETAFSQKSINNVSNGDSCKISGKLSINKKKTKTGASYYQVVIGDNSGKTINQIVFNNASLYPFIEANETFSGKAIVYTKILKNGQYLNMDIKNIVLVIEEPITETEVEEKSNDVMSIINEKISHIINPGLKAICEKIYSNKSFVQKFSIVPATEFSAYNYVGGLGIMTIETVLFAEEIANVINCDNTSTNALTVDTDMLVVGALLCNIGRAYTLEFDETCTKINKTDYGILENDLTIARTQVCEAIKEIKAMKDKDGNPLYELKKDTILELLHMIDSCKGQTQWGAISVPRTKNAMLLSNITSLVFTKGLFENLEKNNENKDRFIKAYDNGRSYFMPTTNME